MSFVAKLAKNSKVPINYFFGTDENGHEAYWFVKCAPEKFRLIERKFNTGPIDFNAYGPVVASGFGKKPSPAVLKKLKDEYDFDAETEFDL